MPMPMKEGLKANIEWMVGAILSSVRNGQRDLSMRQSA